MVRGFLSSSYHPGQWLLSGSRATPVHWCRWRHSINNEKPNMALGDRAPECRFHRQFPQWETKPFDLGAAGRTKKRGRVQDSRGEALAISIPKSETAVMFVQGNAPCTRQP